MFWIRVRRMGSLMLAVVLTMGVALAASTLHEVKLEASTKIYTINLHYLQFEHPDRAQAVFNTFAQREIQGMVDGYKRDVAKENPSVPTDPNLKWSFEMRSHAHLVTRHWVSYELAGGEYTGGAHPIPIVVTTLFDLTRGHAMKLGDMFRKGAPYLSTLSTLSRAYLAKQDLGSDADWQKRGTEATEANFQAFYLDGQNLVVVFPPYQVAPYAAGVVEFKIPLANLRNIARGDGPLVVR